MPFRFVFIVLCAIFLIQGAYAEELQREFSVKPGQQLTLDLRTGAGVRIEGWDKSVVRIDGSVIGNRSDEIEIEAEQTPSGVELTTRYRGREDGHHNSDGEFDIRVPNQFNVEIQSMGGSITLRNVNGEFEGSTMGGELNLSDLKGKISLSTMGGDITLVRSHLDGEVSTMGGEVMLEEVSGSVTGSSMGGNVIQKRSSGDGKSADEVQISTMGGKLNVQEAPAGAVLSTMGGDIHVVSAKDHVKAKTMGGDIRIDSVDGWVDAETMGGNVQVKMIGDPSKGKRDVELVSLGGDIELTVPENLAMTVDVELAYTKGKSGRYSVQSDFPLKTEETDEWDYEDGSPRKYITATGKVGNGSHRIRIKTINGDVILKKGK